MTATVNQSVLVLNKSWLPTNITSVGRAMKLLCGTFKNGEPRALVVDTTTYASMTWEDWSAIVPDKDNDIIKGVKKDYLRPKIIVLTSYNKVHVKEAKFSRRVLYERDNYECQYCGSKKEINIDHVIPKSKGGLSTWENCVVSCVKCNTSKADRLPKDAGMVLKRKPTKPDKKVLSNKRKVISDFKEFLSEVYWDIELQNENPE